MTKDKKEKADLITNLSLHPYLPIKNNKKLYTNSLESEKRRIQRQEEGAQKGPKRPLANRSKGALLQQIEKKKQGK